MTHIGPIAVNHKYTNDLKLATEWIKQLEQYDIIACDFEAAVKYTEEDIEFLKRVASDEKTKYLHKKVAESALAASALDHPAHSTLTHFSVAWSDKDAYVFILDSFDITKLVLQFLVTTEVKQVWHNACYDFKHLLFHTGKMPKNYEDTQIFAKTLFNHVETHKAKTGLKELAGSMYGAWGVTEDLFSLSEMYNEKLLYYAAVDAAATFWVYQRILSGIDPLTGDELTTSAHYSPWDQLPAPTPKHALYPDHHFYHHTAKWLIRDTVRIMNNGLPIDLQEVVKLEEELEEIIADVKQRLADNSSVQTFLQRKQKSLLSEYIDIQKSRFKTPKDFLVSFDPKKPLHRDYFMYVFTQRVAIKAPEQLGASGKPKWSARTVKIISETYPPLKALTEHRVTPNNPTAVEAMKLLAEDKAEMYNQKFIKAIENPKVEQITFNPNSSLQKQEMFSWLGLQSDVQSAKTGLDSWDREQVERVNKETEDDDIRAFTQCLIDYSFAAIVRDNFVQAFYRYTVEGELHGNYRLLGAKSGRYTSSNPNMLNAPSSNSTFSKPIKKCFKAPKGYIVAAIDYAALEDRVVANLSEDENKLNVFLKGVDGHSLAACFYWPDEVAAELGHIEDATERALKFKDEVGAGNKALKELRSRGKRISFGLAYGAFPPKVARSAKLSLEEATKIFNAYHNELYPMITKYREEYVLTTAQDQGYIHLGLGFRLYSDEAQKDIRSLNNATCQFWSILTALAINKIHQLIDEAGYQNDIKITSTIYDSIYFCMKDDPVLIKWLNDHIIPIMEKDFMEDQILANSVDLEIGPDWSELHKLSHNADIEEIKAVRSNW